MDADDGYQEQRRAEISAYNAPVADGGQPSHPLCLLETIVQAPGEYRNILTLWQDHPHEWQVFTKQWQRWRSFREWQRSTRQAGRPPSHAVRLVAYLRQRLGSRFPLSFTTVSCSLDEDPSSQDRLATWLEYLLYEYLRLKQYEGQMEKHKQRYVDAREKLIKSGVLHSSARRIDEDRICDPSSIQIAGRMYKRRRVEETIRRETISGAGRICRLRSPQGRLELAAADRKLAGAKRELGQIDKRTEYVVEFNTRTKAYRSARDKAERHDALLKWTLALIEKETGATRPALDSSNETSEARHVVLPSIETDEIEMPCMFRQFGRLPAEIRHMIWINCLPARPTVHFFDVFNHPRERHLVHYWSSKEFRVCATRARDSGYRIVYTLLATCQEARVTIAAHYARLQRIEGLDISNAASTADEEGSRRQSRTQDGDFKQYLSDPEHRDGDDETGCARCKPRRDPFSIFQSFDWIPANDLVVLCFPPKQAELPATQAITLARRCGRAARHIGLLLPKEVLLIEQFGLDSNGGRPTSRDGREGAVDDASQVSLIPEFLEALREPSFENCADAGSATAGRGGVKKAYIIVEGWYAPDPYWRFEAARPDETICPWEYYMSDEEMQQRRPGSNRTGTGHRRRQLRQVWWLGSGRGALTLPDVGDIVERSPSSRIEGLATMVKAGCMARGWPEFEGGDTLGLVKVNADEHGQPCVDVSGSGPVGGGR